jgi:hypothetical protein
MGKYYGFPFVIGMVITTALYSRDSRAARFGLKIHSRKF